MWAQPKTVQLDVRLLRAVPDYIVVMNVASLHSDTLWASSQDGCYHHVIPSFESACYELYLPTLGERFPLLLLEPDDTVRVRLRGDSLLTRCTVEGCKEAELYVASHALLREYEMQRISLAQLTDKTTLLALHEQPCVATLQTLLRQRTLQRLDSLTSLAKRCAAPRVVNTLCQLFQIQKESIEPPQDEALWWPSSLYSNTLLLSCREMRYRVEDYIFFFQSDTLTYEEQFDRYRECVTHLANLQPSYPAFQEFVYRQLCQLLCDSPYQNALLAWTPPSTLPCTSAPYPQQSQPITQCLDTQFLRTLTPRTLHHKKKPLLSRDSAYTLLIVGSAWCSHCQEEIPQLLDKLPSSIPGGLAIHFFTLDIPMSPQEPFLWSDYPRVLHFHLTQKELLRFESHLPILNTPAYFLFTKQGIFLSHPQDYNQLQAELTAIEK